MSAENYDDGRNCVSHVHAADGADATGAVVPARVRRRVVATHKRCIYCEQVKPASEFHRHAYVTRRGWVGERFNSSCKACHQERTAARKRLNPYKEQQREYRQKNRERIRARRTAYQRSLPHEKRRAYHVKSKFGLTAEQYAAMLEAQGGVCKVCGSPPKVVGNKRSLHVDHDHQSGRVRGLLCHNCNVSIGLSKDNPDTLEALARYLRASLD